ncbi:MAG: Crp/Fnr family transcriptional regulator [Deltaproteobacteria bacterium]|nr:Crp/Fnr family transcriptional regulator [Deltaproteobacteria bacterium]
MFDPPVRDCRSCPLGQASSGTRCPGTPASYPAGAQPLREGEPPAQVTFLREGLMAQGDVDAASGPLAVRGPRALLGLEALRGKPATQGAVALTPVKVCHLPASGLKAWLAAPGSSRALVELLIDELQRLGDEGAWRRGPCLGRLARFCLAQRDAGADGAVPLPKATVARVLDMRAETLSRCLSALAERGLIDRTSPHAIRDVAGLASLARGGQGQMSVSSEGSVSC